MADHDDNAESLPRLNAEQRRTVATLFERANQVLSKGTYDYAIQLLFDCCLRDPGNLVYRKTLRQAERNKYKDNKKGQPLAFLTNLPARLKMETSLKTKKYTKVLEFAERVFLRNPWDIRAHMAMAEAYEGLDLTDHALWTLENARMIQPMNPKINRQLAILYEQRGNYTQAIALWGLVKKALPDNLEAGHKMKDLAASQTIAKGRYEEAAQDEGVVPFKANQGMGTPTQSDSAEHEAAPRKSAAEERISREAANLLAKVKATPTNANAYLHLAQYYRRMDQFDEARKVLMEGLGPTGNNFEIALELTDLDIEPMRRDLAIAEEKLRQNPKNAEQQALRAKFAKEVANRELGYFRQKVDRFPTDTNARLELGVRLMRVGQAEEAIKELQNLRNDPRHKGRVMFYLGMCFKARNNWRLAQRNLEEAIQAVNDESLRKEIMFQLAQGYADNKELQRAIDLGCELANLDYSFHNIGTLVEEWQARLSRPEGAGPKK